MTWWLYPKLGPTFFSWFKHYLINYTPFVWPCLTIWLKVIFLQAGLFWLTLVDMKICVIFGHQTRYVIRQVYWTIIISNNLDFKTLDVFLTDYRCFKFSYSLDPRQVNSLINNTGSFCRFWLNISVNLFKLKLDGIHILRTNHQVYMNIFSPK